MDKFRYGLYCNGLLVMVMTFGTPRFNKNYDYKIEDIIYRSLRQFINYWLGKDDKKYFNNSFIKKVKKTVNYFIPRFILDVFEIPRNIIRLIKKYLIKNNNQRII